MASKKKKVLLIGGGGRENALARSIAASERTAKLIAAPGNPGIARYAKCVDCRADDVAGLADLAVAEGVDLAVVGPEKALVDGIHDLFAGWGIPVAGPAWGAARLEGSKVFAKQTMSLLGIPQAEPYGVFSDFEETRAYIKASPFPLVVKADGLAAGKGVVMAKDKKEAIAAARDMLVNKRFGDAGNRVVLERQLNGEELSFLFICDGKKAVPLAPARDYKRLCKGDEGPNTGGMGAHSPGSAAERNLVDVVQKTVVSPLLAGMVRMGSPYKGVLYCGLMITDEGPKVLEFNCRFGDPETQVILPRLRTDLVDLLEASSLGSLDGVELSWDNRAALCVILASEGYPVKARTGRVIEGLERLPADIIVDHSGTQKAQEGLVTSSGRVLSIGTLAETVDEAREKVYDALKAVHFQGMQYRTDIGAGAGGA